MCNSKLVERGRCCQCRRALDKTLGKTATVESEREDHTLESLRRCADLNGTIPQIIAGVSQRDATSATLARSLSGTRKGVVRAGVPLVCGHSHFYLPAKTVDPVLSRQNNSQSQEETYATVFSL